VEPQFLLSAKYYLSNEIKKNGKGRACGRHRKEVKLFRDWMEKPESKRPPEELGIGRKVVHMITGLKEVGH